MTQPEDERPPAELEALDAALRGIELKPRASLGPEIANRFAAGERVRPLAAGGVLRPRMRVAATAAVLLLATALMWGGIEPGLDVREVTSTIDRCCQDLDGGGAADDGLLIESVGGQQVRHLVLYEDQEHRGRWSPGAAVRYERLGGPEFAAPYARRDLTVREFCCADYDGGRDVNDGVLVVLSGTDVVLAAVFERVNALEHVRLR